ncbi:MAG: hypothetical protein H7Y17_10705 [Chlorobia bacterium]|nr:hypothetical protein [Fimbriimonadaceae bacterium]
MRRLSSVLASIVVLSAFALPQSAPPKAPPVGGITVYAVEKGKAYHKKNCTLKSGSKGMTLAAAKKKGYKPCKVCKPPK